MFRRVEALKYRCLKYISQPLGDFQVMVGPNGSGKSTFLDVIDFLRDLVRDGPEKAVLQVRAKRFEELVFGQDGDRFELAVNIEVPQDLAHAKNGSTPLICRYEISVGQQIGEDIKIVAENLWLINQTGLGQIDHSISRNHTFPIEPDSPATLMTAEGKRISPKGRRRVVTKMAGEENYIFRAESGDWQIPFRPGVDRAGLASLD
ncbi:MAG: hypothetical protein EXR62_15750 [Chloroflexi bacterium]|nr:hypothetical protein [Chloroflexota bacterium]